MLTTGRLAAGDIERLGWELKPEGLCQRELCVPLPPDAVAADGSVHVEVVGSCLGMPVLHDEECGVWAIGPEAGKPPLRSAQLPDLTLHDFDGNPFGLSQLSGRKTLLVAWASW